MNNCLVTKLKAVVNNPDLPVIETMQQFTIDAINASNNAPNMTDEQKYALNHFFYQIGAISNDGIYAKMSYIGLPMIAGDVAGALNNYVGNIAYTITDNRVALTDHCLVSTVSGNVSLGYNSLPKALTIKTNTSVFAGIKDSNVFCRIFETKDTNDRKTQFSAKTAEFFVANVPYTSQSTAKNFTNSSTDKGAVITVGTGSGDKGYYYDNSDDTVKMVPLITNENLTSDPASLFQIEVPNPSFGNGVYYVFAGEALTEAEATLLLKELVALRNVFVV